MNLLRLLRGGVLACIVFWISGAHAQATDVDCDGCVDSTDISDAAVKGRNIANGHITSRHIKNGNLITAKIKDAAITAEKIASGAVGVTQVDPGQVQLRVGGACQVGSFVTAVNEDGSVVCEEDHRELLDQNELSSIWSNSLNAHFDLLKIGNDLYSCGQSYLFGCAQATSGNDTVFIGLAYFPRTVSLAFWDGAANTWITAIPVDISTGFSDLRFVGVANLSAHRGRGQMLVDDCDNPTAGYVQQSRNPRNPSTPQTVMNNAGQLYEIDSFDSVDVDVTGNTYGVMNFIIHGDNTTPICTPDVSDRTGVWQRYTYTLVVDLNEARFAGPFTYQGSSIGLLDRVQALENP